MWGGGFVFDNGWYCGLGYLVGSEGNYLVGFSDFGGVKVNEDIYLLKGKGWG